MGLQLGMSGGNQSGAFNNSGNNSALTSSMSGSYGNTGNVNRNIVDTTATWDDISKLLQGNVGASGLTPDQKLATDAWKGYITSNDNNGVRQMERAGDTMADLMNGGANLSAGTSTVVAPTAASLMTPYQQGYTDKVVNATNNDLLNAFDKRINQTKMNAAAGGAYGGGRQGVAEAQVTDDFLRTLMTSDANLRDKGYSTSLDAGKFDAGNQLTASNSNAANTLNNNQFNARQMDAASLARLNAANSAAANGANIMKTGSDALGSLYNMSGGGNSNLLNIMNSQTPAFGTTSGGLNTTLQGTSAANGVNSANNSSGYNSGSSSQSGMSFGGK